MARELLKAIGFGLLALALASVRFAVPGIEGLNVDLREVGLLIGVFYLRHWAYTLVTAAIAAVAVPAEGSLAAHLLFHLAAAPVAWFGYQAVARRFAGEPSALPIASAWFGFVLLWYGLLLLPLVLVTYRLFGVIPREGWPEAYLSLLRTVPFEVVGTALTTSLFLSRLHEYARRRRAEAALRDEKRVVESIISAVPLGLAAVSGGRLVFGNDRLAAMSGRSVAELPGTPVSTLLATRSPGSDVAEALANDGGGIELALVRGDGLRVEVLVHAAPLRLRGDEGLMLSMLDVSERVRLEAELREAQRLDALGRLAGAVAHDFNNMLTIISLNQKLIRARLPDGDSVAEELAAVDEAIAHAAGVVAQLLSFARRRPSAPTDVDLGALLARARPMLGSIAGRSIELRLDVAPQLPRIHADPTMVEQTLVNLVLNARDAIDERAGGPRRIVVHAERAPAGAADTGEGGVLMSVSDTGVGMDPATCARVYEPFFTTKADGRGTGLGLSTVYGVVRQHEASIDVQSVPGEGTTFRIVWPAAGGA